ncbi:inositol 2-dehydrogenase [Microvirga tunisiensis]|jgi:myo-inositol 2-dehydrogenase/D-chiro-inositol 1-dehydrogenase|uniref:Inositol 2-dehydrogenase n=1 Tax=Microvirga tunisiensis TaxID=2108360 RepID=A0A5N7MPH1_9HYPH|nr:inositol 2-dehydrogenase [Microvirga tunisiensis]MPR10610.1 inositol 2-dehydrogenase [Microvirga tunisiensis]MPR28738.1 inositol 2-dehydrogenase [Microvirga tunisiensis]
MLRVAVLGAGRIGKIHAANVAMNRNAKLVAVADPFGDAASSLADLLSCEASQDPIPLIERDDVDAVVIGTPTDTHVSLMLHAVRLGKAVLCEKPIDLDIAKADAALHEIERLNGRVMLAFNRRFDPSAQQLRQTIDAGTIGEVRQVIITSRDPGLPSREYLKHSGGIFRDMVIHDFDMARWLLGEEPTEVMATASRLVDPALTEVDDFDTVMVQMRTASGRQCHINCCREAVYGYDQRFEIFGSAGMLQNENLRPTTVRRWTRHETEAGEPLLNFFLERYADAYRYELDAFIAAVQAGSPMPVTPFDGRQALRLADCALESALSGRSVRV